MLNLKRITPAALRIIDFRRAQMEAGKSIWTTTAIFIRPRWGGF